ncbi:MAG TPA: acylphosphatase [bacterium]|nr:acylphosphatase [bacterium]HNZ73602.1 acylphosphatase [bacterium]HOH67473.1 acylphosphatase [bacterium]HPN81065.1 acylphosphatase [bacterium]HPW39478.1 acylphosphatase [bacterium]
MVKRLALKIFGRVQGVGLRYQAQTMANSLGLTGWIKNRPDGSVEAAVEGPEEELKQFLAWCYNGSRLARVDRIDYQWQPAQKQYRRFVIK